MFNEKKTTQHIRNLPQIGTTRHSVCVCVFVHFDGLI